MKIFLYRFYVFLSLLNIIFGEIYTDIYNLLKYDRLQKSFMFCYSIFAADANHVGFTTCEYNTI
jgi:hypothetical protein